MKSLVISSQDAIPLAVCSEATKALVQLSAVALRQLPRIFRYGSRIPPRMPSSAMVRNGRNLIFRVGTKRPASKIEHKPSPFRLIPLPLTFSLYVRLSVTINVSESQHSFFAKTRAPLLNPLYASNFHCGRSHVIDWYINLIDIGWSKLLS